MNLNQLFSVVFAQNIHESKTIDYNFNQRQPDRFKPTCLDIMILFDHSTSLKLNDPDRLRTNAVLYLLDYLIANALLYEINCQTGFVSFAGKPIHIIPLNLLTNKTKQTIKSYLKEEELSSHTDFLQPIKYAYQELKAKSFDSGNRKVIILLTDSRPQIISNISLNEYFKNLIPIISDLQTNNVSLFILAFRDAQKDEINWRHLLTQDNYIPVSNMNDLTQQFHSIITNFLKFPKLQGGDIVDDQIIYCEIEPLLEKISFSFQLSEPEMRIHIKSSDGNSLYSTYGNNGKEYHALFTITNPIPGKWKIYKTGKGQAQYWIDAKYSTTQLILDADYPYSGHPIKIHAWLTRNGVLINRPDILLTAEIDKPAGESINLALNYTDSGQYEGIFKETKIEGNYKIKAKAFLIDIDSKKNKKINVLKKMACKSILPSPFLSEKRQSNWKFYFFCYVIVTVILIITLLLVIVRYKKKLGNQQRLIDSDDIKKIKNELLKKQKIIEKAFKVNDKKTVKEESKKGLKETVGAYQSSIVKDAMIFLEQLFKVMQMNEINSFIEEFLVNAESKAQRDAFIIYFKKYLIDEKETELIAFLYQIDFTERIIEQLSKENDKFKFNVNTKVINIDDINKLFISFDNLNSFQFQTNDPIDSEDSDKLWCLFIEISNSFNNLQTKKCRYASHASNIFQAFAELVKNPLYPDNTSLSETGKLPYLDTVEKTYKQLFNFDYTLKELMKRFQEKNLSELKGIEQKAIKLIIEYWEYKYEECKKLENITDHKLNIKLSPELSLNPAAEKDIYWVMIENLGEIPIYGLKKSNNDTPEEQTSAYHISVENNFCQIISPGGYERIKLRITKNTYSSITVEYRFCFTTWLNKNIPISIKIDIPEVKTIKTELHNPFIPDKPLKHVPEIELFGNLESRNVAIQQLVNRILHEKNQFPVINLFGLRRIGKTSLINMLLNKKDNSFFPAYIDCLSLQIVEATLSKDKIISYIFEEGVYYAIREVYQDFFRSEEKDKDEADYYYYLMKKAVNFLRQKDKKLVIIIDDAQLLSDPKIVSSEKHSPLSYFRHLAIKADFSIVFVTEKEISDFFDNNVKYIPHIIRLNLLEFKEVSEISTVSDILQFSSLSLEYLMRFSGGYTSIVQMICYLLFEKCNNKNNTTVMLDDIQDVAISFIKDSSFRPYIKYLIEGLTDDEKNFLSQLIQEDKIDSFSMNIRLSKKELDEKQKEMIDVLIHKQVIKSIDVKHDKVQTLYKLRIGLFMLLIKEWKIGYKNMEISD